MFFVCDRSMHDRLVLWGWRRKGGSKDCKKGDVLHSEYKDVT